jgi:hypothetical protein
MLFPESNISNPHIKLNLRSMSFCGCALMFLVTPNQRKTPCICGVFIPVHSNAQLSSHRQALRLTRKVATKEHKRHAKGLIEKLESRIHCGPRIEHGELLSVQQFLHQNEFSPASEYFRRLGLLQDRLATRQNGEPVAHGKRNYGGQAGGRHMQLQSIYDHVILSVCYGGEFNTRRGRVKVSHRFNQEGRVDFVELKFLCSLSPALNGAIRKLVLVKDYQKIRKDWDAAEAFILPVLPQELVFLYRDIFRSEKPDIIGWLINIGHVMAGDLLVDLDSRVEQGNNGNPEQLALHHVREDAIALPILRKAATRDCAVELEDERVALVRYVRK